MALLSIASEELFYSLGEVAGGLGEVVGEGVFGCLRLRSGSEGFSNHCLRLRSGSEGIIEVTEKNPIGG